MGKVEQASPRTARPSLKLRMKVMSSGLSLVQETADSIDEVMRSQDLTGGAGHFSEKYFALICSASSFPTLGTSTHFSPIPVGENLTKDKIIQYFQESERRI